MLLLLLSMLLNVQVDGPGVQDKGQAGPHLISTINQTSFSAAAAMVFG